MAAPRMNTRPLESIQSSPMPESLSDMLEAPEYSREALQSNDLRALTKEHRAGTIEYLCIKYRLPTDEGLITTVKGPGGELRPYVTAAGVFHMSRLQVKSLAVTMEPLVMYDGRPAYVVVKSTATTLDGRVFEALGAKRIEGAFDMALMKADTAARVRACKAAVGLSLMTYAEAVTLDEHSVEEKEPPSNVE